jgi:hypothetical protein
MTILYFPQKRGRPKAPPKPEKDMGTPELQDKRKASDTTEALDLCLEKGLITPEQHWCGIHLRWLYTLRHGAPGVRAIDLNHISGVEIASDDPAWREAREAEYHEALKHVARYGDTKLLMNICIHNERPGFLSARTQKSPSHYGDLVKLRDALDVLAHHWRRGKKNV